MGALIQSSVDVKAAPERVWRILTDFSSHPEWNPVLVMDGGQPLVGERVNVTLRTGEGRERRMEPRIETLQPNQAMVWRQNSMLPWLRSETYRITLEPRGGEGTRVNQEYEVTGLLSSMGDDKREPLRRALDRMNEALQQRAESTVAV